MTQRIYATIIMNYIYCIIYNIHIYTKYNTSLLKYKYKDNIIYATKNMHTYISPCMYIYHHILRNGITTIHDITKLYIF